jgi:PPOX class probable F420-dependent enzyme
MERSASFSNLNSHRYLALTTYRKNGAAVLTPVWFVQQGEKLYIWTAAGSGKAKRLRRNPCVQLGPGSHSGRLLGAVQEGLGRFVPEREAPALDRAFKAKYGWQVKLFAFLWKIKRQQHTYIEISPPGAAPVEESLLASKRPGK